MGEFHDDQTIFKVREALRMAGAGGHTADDAIRCMQNAGILFRELAPDGITELNTKVEEIRVMSEEILLNTDQAIRVQALDIAVSSLEPGSSHQFVIARAEHFEDYIKNGVIHA